MPTNNTSRQAMSFDDQRTAVETNTPKNEDRLDRKIKTQINGSWVEVIVDVSSLRQALCLPLHNLFDSGICHGCVNSETVGDDV